MGKNKSYKKGQEIDGWILKETLGKGGNGEVWVAEKEESLHAIKLLKNVGPKTYSRFCTEIEVINDNQDIVGVIPIIDFYLPEESDNSVPWFVMPVTKQFYEWKKGKKTLDIVTGMLELAKTVHELHSRNICHRDIKPANILFFEDRLYLSDFGLVKYPDSKDLTAIREDVGPKFTMAPEMRRSASKSNGLLADVYSFAKTLWVAITDNYLCFDGEYSPSSSISINNYCKGLYTKSLNDLLVECTDNLPRQRPTMSDVVTRLEDWININNDFHNQNLTEWFDLQNKLFPVGSPSFAKWTSVDDIVSIMNEVAHVKSLNHMFYPDGGGNTFIHVERAKESGFIAIKIAEKIFELVNPRKLTYESFGVNPKWNYFRLESNVVNESGVYGERDKNHSSEELVEISPNNYVNRYHWDENEYNGEPLPNEARIVCRYYQGSFVIFSTRSNYNLDTSTYDGRHNKKTEKEFRDYIKRSANQ